MQTAQAPISKKEITIVWLALVGLTLLGPTLARTGATGPKALAALILGIAGLKFLSITWSFMELRLAHRLWMAASSTLAAVALLTVYFRTIL